MNEENTQDVAPTELVDLADVLPPEVASSAPPGPLEIPISPEDLGMLLRSNNATKLALQEMGAGARRLEVLKAEIVALMAKEDAKLQEFSAQVSAAETTFNTLTKAMAAKYEVDLNQKCNIDLHRGFFQVG